MSNGRFIKFRYAGKGYLGTDSDEFFIVPDTMSDREIEADWEDWAWQEHDRWAGADNDDGIEDEGSDGRWRDATDAEIEYEQFQDLR